MNYILLSLGVFFPENLLKNEYIEEDRNLYDKRKILFTM